MVSRRDPFGRMRRSCPVGIPSGKTVEARVCGEFFKHIEVILYCAYILQSEKKLTHYYGHSSDLENRLKKHNAGKVRSTKANRPWKLIYFEEFLTKSEAYKREQFFKSIDGYNYLKSNGII